MSSSDKCKHKTLSAKADIIKEFDKVEKLINLAKKCGVGHAMICDIRKNREKIVCFVKNTDSSPSDRQTQNSGEYPGHLREEQLIRWFDRGNILTAKLHPTSTTNGSECYTVCEITFQKEPSLQCNKRK
jgi:hypothetical protein